MSSALLGGASGNGDLSPALGRGHWAATLGPQLPELIGAARLRPAHGDASGYCVKQASG